MNWYYIVGTIIVGATTISAVSSSFGALRQRLISHELQDKQRFDEISEMLKEVRTDVKTILTTH